MDEELKDYHIICAPLININEEVVTVVEWLVKPWKEVKSGDIVCTLESTKAIVDVETDKNGYIYPLSTKGSKVTVGSSLAYIFQSNDTNQLKEITIKKNNISERLISNKASFLLERNNISINVFPGVGPISELDVNTYIEKKYHYSSKKDPRLNKLDIDDKSLLLYCAGDHADVLYEAVMSRKEYDIPCFIDYSENLQIKEKFGLPVFHNNQLTFIQQLGVKKIHINTNNYNLTKEVFELSSKLGFNTVNIVHASSIISPTSIMGINVFVGANAIVGTQTKIGDFSKVLNGASIAHHSKIGKNCQISDGARIAGNATLGNNCLVGLNSTVNMKITIGNNVTIASGKNVYNDILSNSIYRK